MIVMCLSLCALLAGSLFAPPDFDVRNFLPAFLTDNLFMILMAIAPTALLILCVVRDHHVRQSGFISNS